MAAWLRGIDKAGVATRKQKTLQKLFTAGCGELFLDLLAVG
jgi:hypothetical protein